jgi:hypothetical protein
VSAGHVEHGQAGDDGQAHHVEEGHHGLDGHRLDGEHVQLPLDVQLRHRRLDLDGEPTTASTASPWPAPPRRPPRRGEPTTSRPTAAPRKATAGKLRQLCHHVEAQLRQLDGEELVSHGEHATAEEPTASTATTSRPTATASTAIPSSSPSTASTARSW